MKRRKKKLARWEERLKQQAANRRKLLKSLSPEARKMTEKYFAQMGLFQ